MAGRHKIRLVECRSALSLSAAQWNTLAAGNETCTVFQTYEWFDSWWRALSGGRDMFLLEVTLDNEVIGFAALMLSRGALGLRRLEFVGSGNADYQDFVLPVDKPLAIAAIVDFLVLNSHRWDHFYLSNVPSTSSTLVALEGVASRYGLDVAEDARVRCPVLRIREEPSYAAALIDKYSMRRPLNWFSGRGEVRFRHVMALEEIHALLPVFFEQHVGRSRAVGRVSLFERADQRAFYADLASTLHDTGWLTFSVVEFNGAPIAFHFGFDFRDSVVWYKPAFDIRYAARSPGLLLARELIGDAARKGRAEVDFTIGEEEFKARFANHERCNLYLSVYHRRSVTGSIAARARSLRRWLGAIGRRVIGPKHASGLRG